MVSDKIQRRLHEFTDPDPAVFLKADPDPNPGGKMNADPCGSGSRLTNFVKKNSSFHVEAIDCYIKDQKISTFP